MVKKQVQVSPYQARNGCRDDLDSSTTSMPWTLHAFRNRMYVAHIAAQAIMVPVVLIPERKSKTSLEETLTDRKARDAGKQATMSATHGTSLLFFFNKTLGACPSLASA